MSRLARVNAQARPAPIDRAVPIGHQHRVIRARQTWLDVAARAHPSRVWTAMAARKALSLRGIAPGYELRTVAHDGAPA